MSDPNLMQMITKIEAHTTLDPNDRAALLSLPHTIKTLERSAYIVREGQPVTRSCVMLSGFAFRHSLTSTGARQIMSINIPGDFVDLEGALLGVADHNVQALTRCEVAFIPHTAILNLIADRPRVGMALWRETLVESAIFREWIVNVGRRDARTRIAHLLCEFARRMETVGLATGYCYELPMTQEQLGDATGLTSVHVNRTLRDLDREQLIERKQRHISIPQWEALRRIGDFNETYLHLGAAPAERHVSRSASSGA